MEKTLLAVGLMMLLGASLYLNNTQEVSDEIDTANLYANWKMKYNRRYTSQRDEMYRFKVFSDNLNYIRAFQDSTESATYTLELNQFADMSQQEFASTYLSLRVPKTAKLNASNANFQYKGAEVDWTDNKKVKYPAVKNQGSCGSCWAFSAVGALEINTDIELNKKYELSEQDLVDCSGPYDNEGCNGGWMDSAFEYVADNGLAEAKDYPYTAKDGTCKTSVKRPYTHVQGFTDIDSCDELAQAIQERTVSVAVDANPWQFYRSGVLSKCTKNLNHGVVLVGVQADGAWKIRNSWGSSWGEAGHIRLAGGDTCGICAAPSFPILG
ncbi:unnamed protein product (macronuclear) [Paramecium tetraurelia]|nr:uncharacterized protein GSPATT00022898001 [Paramecium tetraurelia]CAK89725.1 unnamed protein product [Paramecium tetraurelia]|eukprot:XP_001457122.1 hypothetical protein (macronuclear) [Paramecium tetraurelia strain d4-2]